MGPERDHERAVRLETFERVKAFTQTVSQKYFENPIHYLFYIDLSLTVGGLFFGNNFSFQFYFLLFSLAGAEVGSKFAHYYFNKEKKVTK